MHREEFDSILAKLRPVIGDMADAFWLGALLDPARRQDLEAVARAMAAELLDESYVAKHILLEPPQAQAVAGDYRLGTVLYAGRPVCPFALRESDMPQHVLIIGRSGAGKTNVGHLLVSGLLRAGKPFIVLDWRGNYRHFGKEQTVPTFSLGQDESLSFNPLDPPANLSSGQREAYLRDIISVVSTTYLPGHHLLTARGAEYFLLRALHHLSPGGEPATFNDLLAYVEAQKTRSRCSEWRGAALTVLFRLTTGPIGRLANSSWTVRPSSSSTASGARRTGLSSRRPSCCGCITTAWPRAGRRRSSTP
jgi:hypothetical protein